MNFSKQINLEFSKFRSEGPKLLNMLQICFKDIIAIGSNVWAPFEDLYLHGEDNGNDNDSGEDIAFIGGGDKIIPLKLLERILITM